MVAVMNILTSGVWLLKLKWVCRLLVAGLGFASAAAFAQNADLSINITGALSVNGGSSYTYTAVVGNSGPNAANNSVFTDNFSALPILGNVVATCTGTTGGAVCPASFTGGSNVSAIIPTFPVGSTVTMTFTVVVKNDSATTSMSNTANIAVPSGTSETTPANNTATISTSIVPQGYDIRVTETQSISTLTPGVPITYTVAFTNIAGAGTAIITGRDDAAMSLTAEATPFISPTITMTHTGIVCTATGGATCPVFGNAAGSYVVSRTSTAAVFFFIDAIVPPGGAVTFTYTATPSINTTYCGTYTAYQINTTAGLDSSTPTADTNAANNSATVVSGPTAITPPACAVGPDMGVTKTQTVSNLGNIAITPGSNTYKVVYRNNGAGTAQGVVFRDMVQFPPNATGGSANIILGSYSWTWTCTATAGVVCPVLSGSGSVSNGNNNTVLNSTTVSNWAAGASLTYDFVFSNITVPVTVCGLTGSDKMTNYADIAASTTGPDPVASNNVVRVSTDFTFSAKPCVDLAVSKTVSTAAPAAGAPLTFTVTISNSGGSTGAALSVPFTDVMPNGFNYVSSGACVVTTVGAGTTTCGAASALTCTGCAAGGGTLTGTIPSIAPGGVVTYTIVGTATTNYLYYVGQQNTASVATVTANYGDTNTISNTASANFDVKSTANVSITKTDGKTYYTPGTANTYTIVIGNAGPGAGDGTVLKDPAITGLTGVTVTCGAVAGGAVCPAVANITTALLQGAGITIPTLPVGSTVTFTVTGTVPLGTTAAVSNTATVTTPGGVTDPTPANNTATDTDTKLPPTLTVTKTATPSTFVVGQSGQFYTITIAVASGPTTALITLSDVLPTGVTTSGGISVTGGTLTVGSCTTASASGASNLAGCSIATGAIGPIVITVPVNVAANTVNPSTNTATVTGGGDPACTGVATACTGSVVTPVTLNASLMITKTDGKSVTTSGGTNNYVVTLTNQGPSPANGVVVNDVVGAGLTCPSANVVVCSVITAGAVCPVGPLTIGNLTGAGLTIATLPANSALQFAYACTVN